MSVKVIGVMTGNSLDAADAVLTEFDDGKMVDLAGHTVDFPVELRADLLKLRANIAERKGDVAFLKNNPFFDDVLTRYTVLTAECVNALCAKANIDKAEIAAIGLHGQTCDHFPPSVAGELPAYTLQIADAPLLAKLTDLPVIYDFRSDDIMQGGEGAPLAPVHNRHIARDLKRKGLFPVAFCNAGNTGNIAVISKNKDGKDVTLGWDGGPFNHFVDALVRRVKNEPCDKDGRYGKDGIILPELLQYLFDTAALRADGTNFLLCPPPKSGDPAHYRTDLDALVRRYGFTDTLRTLEYFSAYVFCHTLTFIPEEVALPQTFLLFGGGWKNPIILNDFKALLTGDGVILAPHKDLFARLIKRFEGEPTVAFSDACGYSGTYMEARIFADMAYCRITGEPFCLPETTGGKAPTVAGIYALPDEEKEYLLTRLMRRYGTETLINNDWHEKYSRAAKGWQALFATKAV